MHLVFGYLLKIFEYAAKQAYKQLQYNKAKLLEPASMGFIYIGAKLEPAVIIHIR